MAFRVRTFYIDKNHHGVLTAATTDLVNAIGQEGGFVTDLNLVNFGDGVLQLNVIYKTEYDRSVLSSHPPPGSIVEVGNDFDHASFLFSNEVDQSSLTGSFSFDGIEIFPEDLYLETGNHLVQVRLPTGSDGDPGRSGSGHHLVEVDSSSLRYVSNEAIQHSSLLAYNIHAQTAPSPGQATPYTASLTKRGEVEIQGIRIDKSNIPSERIDLYLGELGITDDRLIEFTSVDISESLVYVVFAYFKTLEPFLVQAYPYNHSVFLFGSNVSDLEAVFIFLEPIDATYVANTDGLFRLYDTFASPTSISASNVSVDADGKTVRVNLQSLITAEKIYDFRIGGLIGADGTVQTRDIVYSLQVQGYFPNTATGLTGDFVTITTFTGYTGQDFLPRTGFTGYTGQDYLLVSTHTGYTGLSGIHVDWAQPGAGVIDPTNYVASTGETTGAPVDGTYLVVTTNATLTNERRLVVGSTMQTIVDGGANGDLTIDIDPDQIQILTGHISDVSNPHSITTGQISAAPDTLVGTSHTHFTNVSNPHLVTTGDTNAAPSSLVSTFHTHATNVSNPHNVSVSQIGAATGDVFNVHINASNPHSITTGDTNAAPSSLVSTVHTHTSNVSNPHNVLIGQVIGVATGDDFNTHVNASNPHSITTGDINAAPDSLVTTAHTHFDNGSNTHTQIDSHISDTNTPHSVDLADIAGAATGQDFIDHVNASNPHGITTGDIDAAPGNVVGRINTNTVNINANTTSISTNSGDLVSHTGDTSTHGVGTVVGRTETQTLTNKTLTSPTITIFSNMVHDHSENLQGGTISHLNLDDIGSNAHSVIDTHIGSSSNPHSVTTGDISAAPSSLVTTAHIHFDNGTNTHTQIDSHISDTNNPHSVDLADIAGAATGQDFIDHVAASNPHSITTGDISASPAGLNTIAHSHFANVSNPHVITVGQIGAATGDTFNTHVGASTNTHVQIDSHLSNTSNPHSVDLGDIAGAATGDDFNTHVNASNPHSITTGDISAAPAGLVTTAHTHFDNGTNTHTQIDSHIADMNNPHSVDIADIPQAASGQDFITHVAASNPHSITTGDISAAPAGLNTLSHSHFASTSNPHSVGLSDIPAAATGATFNTHTNASNPHSITTGDINAASENLDTTFHTHVNGVYDHNTLDSHVDTVGNAHAMSLEDIGAATGATFTAHVGLSTNTHVQLDSHLSSTSNPHSVDLSDIAGAATGDTYNTHIGIGGSVNTHATIDNHIDVAANPHSITTGTISAAPAGLNTLAHTHFADAANPHGITLSSIGAATGDVFNTHESNTTTHGITGNIVGTVGPQSLANKTMTQMVVGGTDFLTAQHDHSEALAGGNIDHTLAITNVGDTTHATIDTILTGMTGHTGDAGLDHHTQYHTDGRADTWIASVDIGELSNVTAGGIDGDHLVLTAGSWTAETPAIPGVPNFDGLGDTTFTSLTNQNVAVYSGDGNWYNRMPRHDWLEDVVGVVDHDQIDAHVTGADAWDTVHALSGLVDLNITGAGVPGDSNVLLYNLASTTWVKDGGIVGATVVGFSIHSPATEVHGAVGAVVGTDNRQVLINKRYFGGALASEDLHLGSTTSSTSGEIHVGHIDGTGGTPYINVMEQNRRIEMGNPTQVNSLVNIQGLDGQHALRLDGTGATNCSARLNFGDGDWTYIDEPADDVLRIFSDNDLMLFPENDHNCSIGIDFDVVGPSTSSGKFHIQNQPSPTAGTLPALHITQNYTGAPILDLYGDSDVNHTGSTVRKIVVNAASMPDTYQFIKFRVNGTDMLIPCYDPTLIVP